MKAVLDHPEKCMDSFGESLCYVSRPKTPRDHCRHWLGIAFADNKFALPQERAAADISGEVAGTTPFRVTPALQQQLILL